jgi:hypothetical protein
VRVILTGAAVLVFGVLLLPRLARRIDSTVGPVLERVAAMEAQYRDMTNAYPIASEMAREHPMHRRWEERRAALMEAGYIETRELRMTSSLAAKGAVRGFFMAFHSRFPGVECSVRDAKSDQPLIVITARKSDFGPLGAIERFVSQYEASQ